MDWLRWWHGTVSDPKLKLVSRKADAPLACVIAMWAALLETASNIAGGDLGVTRGDVSGFDCEAYDAMLDAEDGTCARILAAFVVKGMVKDDRIANWEKRQPKREDAGDPATGAKSAAQRKREQRERERALVACASDSDTQSQNTSCNVTQCHDESRDFTTDKIREDKKREPLNTIPSGIVIVGSETYDESPTETKAKRVSKRQESIAFLVSQGVKEQHAADWLTARKGKEVTATAWAKLCSEADKANMAPAQAVEYAAGASWAGFNAEWFAKAQGQHAQHGQGSARQRLIQGAAAAIFDTDTDGFRRIGPNGVNGFCIGV